MYGGRAGAHNTGNAGNAGLFNSEIVCICQHVCINACKISCAAAAHVDDIIPVDECVESPL